MNTDRVKSEVQKSEVNGGGGGVGMRRWGGGGDAGLPAPNN